MYKLKLTIWLLVLLPAFCARSQPGPALPGAGNSYQQKLDSLYSLSKRLLSVSSDSLLNVVNQFKTLNSQHRDVTSKVYAEFTEAEYYWLTANHIKAINLAIQSLNNAVKGKVTKCLPSIYSLIGNLQKEDTNYPLAFDAANKGLAVARQLKDTSSIISMLGLKAMLVRTYNLHYNKPIANDGSNDLQFEGLKLATTNPKYELISIKFYDNIAQHYKDVEQYAKAIFYAKKGIRLAQKYNQKRSMTYAYSWLGQSYCFSGKKKDGIACMHKAIQLSVEIKQPYRTMELYNEIAACYKFSGDYKDALDCEYKYIALRDTLQAQVNEKQMSELQIKYETAQKNKDIALLDRDNRLKSRQMIWFVIGALIFVPLTIVLLFMYRVILDKNIALSHTNQQINEQSQKVQTLIQELHHRVKNNLQIVSSLLNLQSSRLRDKDAQNALTVSRQRIEAMSIIHNSLYQHDSTNMFNMKEYVTSLIDSIRQSFGLQSEEVEIKLDVMVKDLDVDAALPLGLILNEWITNAFKHAYRNINHQPVLELLMHGTGHTIKICVKDNGSGMPMELWENPKTSFGIKLIKILVKQIRGKCKVYCQSGTTLDLTVPI